MNFQITVASAFAASTDLFDQRRRAADQVVVRVEDYVNRLAHSPKNFDKSVESYRVEVDRFSDHVQHLEVEAARVAKVGSATGTAGALAGVGVAALGPSAALAVATTFGTASTGTAVSTLSGAASANAALAWLGGGAMAAGGGGVAAGNALLAFAGPVGWTVAGVSLVGAAAYLRSRNAKYARIACTRPSTTGRDASFGHLEHLMGVAFDETANTQMRFAASIMDCRVHWRVRRTHHQVRRGRGRIHGGVAMDNHSLDEFSPELYVAILSEVAHSDGLDAEELAILAQYASRFEVDLDALPDIPADLSDVSWSTRILIYRDACMLASADGSISSAEETHLADLASRMALPSGVTESVRAWVRDYGNLLERLDDLLNCRRADGET